MRSTTHQGEMNIFFRTDMFSVGVVRVADAAPQLIKEPALDPLIPTLIPISRGLISNFVTERLVPHHSNIALK